LQGDDIDMNIRHQNRGLTLVELLVAMLIAIILIAGVVLMHNAGRTSFVDAETLSRIQENVRFASDYMIRDIRNAGFRDENMLKVGHETQIRQAYATIIDGDTLRIRYAGRGTCSEAFDTFRLVENEYSLTDDGELACYGRSVAEDAAGSVQITAQNFDSDGNAADNDDSPIALVSGVTDLDFEFICPDGTSSCSCDQISDFDNACIGVRIALQFEGLFSQTSLGARENRTVELTAAFRNIILDRMNDAQFSN
jgi:hypothetical protein